MTNKIVCVNNIYFSLIKSNLIFRPPNKDWTLPALAHIQLFILDQFKLWMLSVNSFETKNKKQTLCCYCRRAQWAVVCCRPRQLVSIRNEWVQAATLYAWFSACPRIQWSFFFCMFMPGLRYAWICVSCKCNIQWKSGCFYGRLFFIFSHLNLTITKHSSSWVRWLLADVFFPKAICDQGRLMSIAFHFEPPISIESLIHKT